MDLTEFVYSETWLGYEIVTFEKIISVDYSKRAGSYVDKQAEYYTKKAWCSKNGTLIECDDTALICSYLVKWKVQKIPIAAALEIIQKDDEFSLSYNNYFGVFVLRD